MEVHLEIPQKGIGSRIGLIGTELKGSPGRAIQLVARQADRQLLAQVIGQLPAGGQKLLSGEGNLTVQDLTDY